MLLHRPGPRADDRRAIAPLLELLDAGETDELIGQVKAAMAEQ